MDTNSRTKRRGLITKSKLVMSLYRAAKPSSAAAVQPYAAATKPPPPVKPIHSNSPPSSIEFMKANHQVFTQPTPNKVAFVVTTERNRDSYHYGKLENFYSGSEDEAVDAKAARYISSVQERFRLERVNSERNNKNNYEQIIHL